MSPRYQLIALAAIGHLLLDLGLSKMAIEQLERGLELGRDTGIQFWRAAIDTHLAVARTRLGEQVDTSILQATLDVTRQTSERYMMVRCLDGLSEIAFMSGDAQRCRVYADELLEIAQVNALRELEAVARRWRGEASLMTHDVVESKAEFTIAATLAESVGRVRLQLDLQTALARVCEIQGQSNYARLHHDNARSIANEIELSLESSGIEARLLNS